MTVTTPRGEVLRDGGGVRLELTRSFDEPAEEVWSALTDHDLVARWFGSWSGDPSTGTVELVMAEEEPATPQVVTIIECEPLTRLVVELPIPDGTWPLSVEVHQGATGSTLVFTQRLAEPYDASGIGPGWHYYLDRLGAVIRGADVPGDWDAYDPSLREAYALPPET